MRDDVLDCFTCIEWTESQLNVLGERIKAWKNSCPYSVVAKEHSDPPRQTWEIEEAEPLPRIINAEAGIIIHALRSSLDILANRLAERNGHVSVKDVYFPVCLTKASFVEGNRSGAKKIKRLSTADQAAIERLQPYHGGDILTLLWSLHDLDIERKHRQLVGAHASPHGMGIYRRGSLPPDAEAALLRQFPEDGYVLPRGTPNSYYDIQIRIEVTLDHIGPLGAKELISALRQLICATKHIVRICDDL